MKNFAIKENHLYGKTFKRGKCSVGRYTAVYVLRDLAAEKIKRANPEKKYLNRLGLSVTKKVGGAVVRNRAKRIIRAAYDIHKADLKTGFLIVISARSSIVGRTSVEIAEDLHYSFDKLSMFRGQKNNDRSGKTNNTNKNEGLA